MKTECRKLILFLALVIFPLLPSKLLSAYSIAPSFFQGTEQVPIADLIKKLEKKPKNENSSFDLARLHQAAYARKAKYLTGEKFYLDNGYEFLFFPGISVHPDRKKIAPAKNAEEEKVAKDHLKEAIKYFTQVIETKKPYTNLAIGGLPTPEEALRRLQARSYQGLIWCLRESGEDEKARTLYAPMMKKASEASMSLGAWELIAEAPPVNPELKPKFQGLEEISPQELIDRWNQVVLSKKTPFSIWIAQADLWFAIAQQKTEDIYIRDTGGENKYYVEGLVPVPPGDPQWVSDEKAADYLRQAIALYQKILSLPVADLKAKTPSYRAWTVDLDRLLVKASLVGALAKNEPREKTLARYGELLNEALEYDKRQAPETSNFSIDVYELMQPYLDPEKDAAFIQEVNQRFKDSKIKAYREPNFD